MWPWPGSRCSRASARRLARYGMLPGAHTPSAVPCQRVVGARTASIRKPGGRHHAPDRQVAQRLVPGVPLDARDDRRRPGAPARALLATWPRAHPRRSHEVQDEVAAVGERIGRPVTCRPRGPLTAGLVGRLGRFDLGRSHVEPTQAGTVQLARQQLEPPTCGLRHLVLRLPSSARDTHAPDARNPGRTRTDPLASLWMKHLGPAPVDDAHAGDHRAVRRNAPARPAPGLRPAHSPTLPL